MDGFDAVLERNVRRRRRTLSRKKRAASLFLLWHGVRELLEEAERLDDRELVHFLAVAQLLIVEKASELEDGLALLRQADTTLPN